MNERIRELAAQAGITTNLDTDFFEKDINKWIDYYSEKLADSIVQECIKVLEQRHKTFSGSKSEYSNGFRSGLDAATRTVKHHFGVES